MFKRLLFYGKFSLPFFMLQKEVPLVLGLVITDRCELSCKHCRVSNTGRTGLTMEQVRNKLEKYYKRGYRELYIEGGEPFLWNDGPYELNDVVVEAKEMGYFHIHIYTNGLHTLASDADMLWVSVDGLKETYSLIRGNYFDKVLNNIKTSKHCRIAIVYTINNINKEEIKQFLQFIKNEKLNVLGVIFYFHTPYYGIDDLFIDFEERKVLIDRIIQYKRQGFPVFNSYAGLKALQSGKWKRPNKTFAITDVEGDYICCRYNSTEVCQDCGYGACTEITEAQKLKPSAVKNLLRFW